MAIDHERARTLRLPAYEVQIERGRLRAFAKAIGETDPVYLDVDAARLAGHPDLPAPPTFLFSLYLEAPDPLGFVREIGGDLRGLLHGEQSFGYRDLVYAGDTITVQPRVAEAYAKNDRMDFVLVHVDYHRHDHLVAEADNLLVIRQVRAA